MADSSRNSQVAGTPYPRPQERQAPAPTTSKLRESCHACALSKVRCHKEKPSCSRCVKRGVTCQYFITKRSGRKRDSGQNTNSNSNYHTANTSATFSKRDSYLTPIDLSPTSSRSGNWSGVDGSLDLFPDLSMPLEPSLYSGLEDLCPGLFDGMNEFDEIFTSPVDFSELEGLGPSSFTEEHSDIAKLAIHDGTNLKPNFEHSLIEFLSTPKPHSSPSNDQAFRGTDTSPNGIFDSASCCLVPALDLMKKLSSTKSSACTPSNRSDDATTTCNMGSTSSIHIIIMENKQNIEAVSNILQCPCAEDGYLLTILPMIVCKIIGQYAAAVQRQPKEMMQGVDKPLKSSGSTPSRDHIEEVRNYGFGDEGLGRVDAQMILSELHHVQRLINQLSPRLKARGVAGTRGARNAREDSDGETRMAPFSTDTLDQIEVDIRKCLSNLSSEIISMLRHG